MPDETIDLDSATIAETSGLLGRRGVSPAELTEATIRRMEKLQPILLPFITPTSEYAMLRAEQAEREIAQGSDRGPLHGSRCGRFSRGRRGFWDRGWDRPRWSSCPWRVA